MKPYEPSLKIAVRDNPDDDLSDDVEDDVFIRDGRSSKAHEENGLKRPLMAPRRKSSNKYSNSVASIFKKRRKCWKCCEPFCYGLAALTIIIAIIFLLALLVTMFPVTFQKVKMWLRRDPSTSSASTAYTNSKGSEYDLYNGEIVPCTQISVNKIWSKAFSKMVSESPIRKYDINGDGLDDIIFGYGIDDNFEYIDDPDIPKCEISNTGEIVNCEGGVIALDGASGETLWQRWTAFNVFSIYCTQDLNNDTINDCVASGRGGLIIGLNGQNGNILWQLRDEMADLSSYGSSLSAAAASTINTAAITIDLYTVNAVRDINNDGIADILAVHVEQNSESHAGHIKLISGYTGTVIRTIPTPNFEEVFVPLQMITEIDGTEMLLIITGGQTTPGGIYQTRLHSLMSYSHKNDFLPIFQSLPCGFMVPAILTDITNDQIEDIIVSSFNSTVYAFDGKTKLLLWNYTFTGSESVSSIVPGHFNNDNVTDFMVKYNIGPGFPIYYYSETTILNGLNGIPFSDQMVIDSGGPVNLLGGVSISQTFGGDFFLHWQSICRDRLNATGEYQFIPGSHIIQQSRADTCKLRYNTSTVLKLYAVARHIEPPGAVIFSTDDLIFQLNQTNSVSQVQKPNSVSALKHPKMLKKLPSQTNEEISKESVMNSDINSNANNNNNNNNNVIDYSMSVSSDITDDNKSVQNLNNINKKNFDEDDGIINYNNNNNNLYGNNVLQYDGVNIPDQLKNSIYNNPYLVMDKNYQSSGQLSQSVLIPPSSSMQQQQQQMDIQGNPEEYESYYNEEQNGDRKIPMRTKYPLNRDVRSEIDDINNNNNSNNGDEIEIQIPNDLNATNNDDDLMNANSRENLLKELKTINLNNIDDDEEQPQTLWDLELEKEESEAKKNQKKNNNDDYIRRTIRQDEINQNLLASISSTGVLTKPIDDAPSTIDFVFILNVRESESYPPLFLAEDLTCLEEKLKNYKDITNDENILNLEKNFLKQCLKKRLPNLVAQQQQQQQQHSTKFEAQIVVTRISIKCSCGTLKNGEICSKLNTIDKQKWTGFMGNSGNGVYSSN